MHFINSCKIVYWTLNHINYMIIMSSIIYNHHLTHLDNIRHSHLMSAHDNPHQLTSPILNQDEITSIYQSYFGKNAQVK